LPPKKSTQNKLPAWVDIIFERFSYIYPDTWARRFHDSNQEIANKVIQQAKWEWATFDKFSELDNEIVWEACNIAKHEKSTFPPNFEEFAQFINIAKAKIARKRIKSGEIKVLERPMTDIERERMKRWKLEIDREHKENYPTWEKIDCALHLVRSPHFVRLQENLDMQKKITKYKSDLTLGEIQEKINKKYEFNWDKLQYELREKK